MSPSAPPLVVVPARIADHRDMEALLACLVTLANTAPGTRAVVVDAGSPAAGLVAQLAEVADEVGASVVAADGAGRAAACNTGMELARESGADAVLVDPRVEFTRTGWLDRLVARQDRQGRPAALAGGMLVDAQGLVRDAGRYFSILYLRWGDRLLYAPQDLPEARQAALCVLGDRLTLVRHATLEAIGCFDPAFDGGGADVEYSIRAFQAGLECVLEPAVVARTTAPLPSPQERMEGEAQASEWLTRLLRKHPTLDVSPFVPPVA